MVLTLLCRRGAICTGKNLSGSFSRTDCSTGEFVVQLGNASLPEKLSRRAADRDLFSKEVLHSLLIQTNENPQMLATLSNRSNYSPSRCGESDARTSGNKRRLAGSEYRLIIEKYQLAHTVRC